MNVVRARSLRFQRAWDAVGRGIFSRAWAPALRSRWTAHLPPRSIPRSAPWPAPNREVSERLRTVPGIWRDSRAEDEAYAQGQRYGFYTLHPEAWDMLKYMWAIVLPSVPRLQRIGRRVAEVRAQQPVTPPPTADPRALSHAVRAEAARIGLSAVGFAPFDPRYMFARAASPSHDAPPAHADMRVTPPIDEGSVIVCVMERDWAGTQAIPNCASERAVFGTDEALINAAAALAQFLHAKGFRADVQGLGEYGAVIHYGVEAGLGQLGLNGQLLTPQAGSRCSLTIITTNAELLHDGPVDYGIHKICDACQVCVRRCPPGAIPSKRSYHRGVLKAAIKPERCAPIVSQARGCAICMKVCPVQRYGLDAVREHFTETGEILGRGSDELEGYHWIDAKYYGPGQKPRITAELLRPGGIGIEPRRTVPPGLPTPMPSQAETTLDSPVS